MDGVGWWWAMGGRCCWSKSARGRSREQGQGRERATRQHARAGGWARGRANGGRGRARGDRASLLLRDLRSEAARPRSSCRASRRQRLGKGHRRAQTTGRDGGRGRAGGGGYRVVVREGFGCARQCARREHGRGDASDGGRSCETGFTRPVGRGRASSEVRPCRSGVGKGVSAHLLVVARVDAAPAVSKTTGCQRATRGAANQHRSVKDTHMRSLRRYKSGLRLKPLFLIISSCSASKGEMQSTRPPTTGCVSSSLRNAWAFASLPTASARAKAGRSQVSGGGERGGWGSRREGTDPWQTGTRWRRRRSACAGAPGWP